LKRDVLAVYPTKSAGKKEIEAFHATLANWQKHRTGIFDQDWTWGEKKRDPMSGCGTWFVGEQRRKTLKELEKTGRRSKRPRFSGVLERKGESDKKEEGKGDCQPSLKFKIRLGRRKTRHFRREWEAETRIHKKNREGVKAFMVLRIMI